MLESGGFELCASAELEERGRAFGFDLTHHGVMVRGFALRIEGRVVAYVNRCAHVPVEMDWQPGEFLDADRRWILCSIHGAAYDPENGACVGGPCGRGRLTNIDVSEHGGMAYWYPSPDLQPLAFGDPAVAESPLP